MNIESNTSHVLLGHDSFFRSPLKGSLHRVLNFIQILNSLSHINQKIGTGSFWAEAPNLLSLIDVPLELVSKLSASDLLVLLEGDLLCVDSISELLT